MLHLIYQGEKSNFSFYPSYVHWLDPYDKRPQKETKHTKSLFTCIFHMYMVGTQGMGKSQRAGIDLHQE